MICDVIEIARRASQLLGVRYFSLPNNSFLKVSKDNNGKVQVRSVSNQGLHARTFFFAVGFLLFILALAYWQFR